MRTTYLVPTYPRSRYFVLRKYRENWPASLQGTHEGEPVTCRHVSVPLDCVGASEAGVSAGESDLASLPPRRCLDRLLTYLQWLVCPGCKCNLEHNVSDSSVSPPRWTVCLPTYLRMYGALRTVSPLFSPRPHLPPPPLVHERRISRRRRPRTRLQLAVNWHQLSCHHSSHPSPPSSVQCSRQHQPFLAASAHAGLSTWYRSPETSTSSLQLRKWATISVLKILLTGALGLEPREATTAQVAGLSLAMTTASIDPLCWQLKGEGVGRLQDVHEPGCHVTRPRSLLTSPDMPLPR